MFISQKLSVSYNHSLTKASQMMNQVSAIITNLSASTEIVMVEVHVLMHVCA